MITDRSSAPAEAPAGRLVPVNGLELYCELLGSGPGTPLVLLHGGVGASEMFGPNLPALAARRRLLALHLQGHGFSSDDGRPLHLESMADDVVALVRSLEPGPVDLLGYSLGAGVALQAAFRHPDAVRRLVVAAQPFRRSGWYPEVLAAFDHMAGEVGAGMSQSPLARLYPGKDWVSLFAKLGDLLRRDYDWSRQVAALRTPTLLLFADADAIQPAHILEFYALLGGGQRDAGLDGSGRSPNRLGIVPGTSHYSIMASSLVAEMVLPFVEEEG